MRLIDADALVKFLESFRIAYQLDGAVLREKAVKTMIDIIANPAIAPTIEAEPVRHGKWVLCEGFIICCECGASPADWEAKPNNPLGLPPFCHSCGAKMDLE